MATKRCENGHYYDPAKHTTCPSCGVQNINFEATRGKETPPPAGGPPTDVKKLPVDDGKTRALGVVQSSGIEPVVGWLVCVEGPDRGRDYRIRSERNFIGRGDKMDIRVTGDDAISRENHAIVSYNPKNRQFKIHPGEARGLVYLNGAEVDGPSQLFSGDHVEIGKTKLLFVPLCGTSFGWE
jgi:hypothetical protein